MSNLNAGTGLTTLPLEIKQKIFELVLFDNPRPLERLSILRVSRAIGTEAADVFYNEETFAFCLDFKSIRRYPVPPVGVIRRTQNVVFTVSGMWEGFKRMTPWAAFYGTYYLNISSICHASLAHVSGSTRLRKSCRICFDQLHKEIDEMVDCPFFSILKTMTGFKTLSLEFVIPVMPIPRHAQSENTPTSLRNEQYKTDTAYNMKLLQTQLEPALGPATSEILPNPNDQNLVGYLVFHPR